MRNLIAFLFALAPSLVLLVSAPPAFAACDLSFPPPPNAGMTYVNWHFNVPDLHTFEFEIYIDNNPGTTSNLFLQLYDANIDGSAQYFGLQTTGLALFSRFGTANPADTIVPIGSTLALDGNPNNGEGSTYVSVRRNLGSLPAGWYSVRITRSSYDGAGDWFAYYVTPPSGAEQYIGSIRFPRTNQNVPASFRDGGGTWTEFWDNNGSVLNPVPLWRVRTSVTANGVAADRAVSAYSAMPNSDIYAESPSGFVNHVLGGCTKRVHPAGSLWVPMPDLTAGSVTPTKAIPGIPVTFSSAISNTGRASTGTSFSGVIQVATAANGGGTITDLPAVTTPALAIGANATIETTYTFPRKGVYSVRTCADKTSSTDSGVVPEWEERNNCSSWQRIDVEAACAVSPTSGPIGTTFTWSVRGLSDDDDGPFIYSWSGAEDLSGTGSSVEKTYSSAGSKSGSLSITSGSSVVKKLLCGSATVTTPGNGGGGGGGGGGGIPITLPPLSLAGGRIPFGGFDVFRYPCVCDALVPAGYTPPRFFFDYIITIGSGVPGVTAVPFTPLAFPGGFLIPGMQAIGFETPVVAACGFYIPYPPPGKCWPLAFAPVFVSPFTGSAAGGFGF